MKLGPILKTIMNLSTWKVKAMQNNLELGLWGSQEPKITVTLQDWETYTCNSYYMSDHKSAGIQGKRLYDLHSNMVYKPQLDRLSSPSKTLTSTKEWGRTPNLFPSKINEVIELYENDFSCWVSQSLAKKGWVKKMHSIWVTPGLIFCRFTTSFPL